MSASRDRVLKRVTACNTDGCPNVPKRRRFCDSCVGRRRYANRKNPCSAPGCMELGVGRLCSKHATRFRLYGAFDGAAEREGRGETPAEKFYSNVDRSPGLGPNGDCHEWRGTPRSDGYGTTGLIGNKQMLAHRAAYLLAYGVEPAQLGRHSCDNRRCVRPDHIINGTHADNARDMVERGRSLRGSRQPGSILNEQGARQVKTLIAGGVPNSEVARILDITPAMVKCIRQGRTWRHI